MGEAVIIPKGDERPYFKLDLLGTCSANDAILDDRGVLALHHEHRLLDLHSFHFKCERRKGIEAKLFQEPITFRMNDARIIICAKLEWAAIDDESFVQF